MAKRNRHRARTWFAWVVAAALVSSGAAIWWLAASPHACEPLAQVGRGVAAPTVAAATSPRAPSRPTTDRQRILAKAYSLLGVPYTYGAKGPGAYDCSGFTKAAYLAGGVKLPDGSFNQAAHERPLADTRLLAPGDLIFYRWAGKSSVSHVTMYAGDGWVIGTGTPGQPPKVTLYPLAADLRRAGDVLTYRHVRLPDER
ncbi:MAG: NlpC/P60 family protein [Coriobacteriia bacterium]|nr:NlpC/P60 family protein [Coriobacteriia bacterium]